VLVERRHVASGLAGRRIEKPVECEDVAELMQEARWRIAPCSISLAFSSGPQTPQRAAMGAA